MVQALKFNALVSGNTLPLPDLSAFEGKRVEVVVLEEEGQSRHTAAPPELKGLRPLGLYRGQFTIPDDFDQPLPTEVQKYFDDEGDGS